MKKVKVVAHVYFKGCESSHPEYYDDYFKIGTECLHVDDAVHSPSGSFQYMNENGVSARAVQSAIIFRPV